MKYKVEKIRSFRASSVDYPNSRVDPELSKYVDDEFEVFIVSEDGKC